MKVLLIVFLAGLAMVSSDFFKCDPVVAIDHFEFKEMVGTWYEFKWYSGKLDQFKSWFVRRKCSKQVYEYVSEKTEQLCVTITDMKSNGDTKTSNGIVHYKNDTVKNGDIIVTADKVLGFFEPESEYNVLAFLPGKYCIVHSCFVGIKSVVVLTSVQIPSEDDRKLIEEGILKAHKCGAPAPSDYKEHSPEECKSKEKVTI